MIQNVLIGCVQITWRNVPEEQVLAEIAQAGYAGATAGPRPDRSADETLALFARFGLKPAPAYLGANFWDPAQESEILTRAEQMAAFALRAGVTELYVAAGGFNNYVTRRGLTRNQIAGHVQPEDSMTDAEFDQFAKTLNQVGELTLEYGVRSCFHNHVGATIETRAEIDRLFNLVDRNMVFLGPDTGHLAWAGDDVVRFCRDYAGSIKTMHLKDVNPDVLRRGQPDWGYRRYSDEGIWTELGQGCVDFPAIFSILAEAGFSGWLLAETDQTQLPTAYESAVVSRNYLRSLGL
jgi:inosose dehydratase